MNLSPSFDRLMMRPEVGIRHSVPIRPSKLGWPLEAYLQLQKYWAQTAPWIVTEPVSDTRLLELEHRYGVRLPDDFRDYLRSSAPVEQTLDDRMTTWWTFERIRNIPDGCSGTLAPIINDGGKQYLFFADWLIWSQAWAISCTGDESRGKVVLIAGPAHDKVVAESFSTFVDLYVQGDRAFSSLI